MGLGNYKQSKALAAPTAYAIKQKAFTSTRYKTEDGLSAGWWWLRSSGSNQTTAAYVYANGSLAFGNVVDSVGNVRPVLWVDLESDYFNR